jgi:DNA polymerase III alpha subunit (gram-positive type)
MDTQETELVVLDFETTGISPRRDRVIEVGAVIIRHTTGAVLQTLSALCLPHLDTKVSKSVSNLTGITTAMLQGQSSTAEVIARLIEFVGSRPILAHNVRTLCHDATTQYICDRLLLVHVYRLLLIRNFCMKRPGELDRRSPQIHFYVL